jgi:tRNA(Ile)-lysidine synthase
MHAMVARTRAFVRAHRLLRPGSRVLVALSGGPDSVALLLILHELMVAGEPPFGMHVAHLNHCLRGADSDAEEAFCRRLAEERGLDFVGGRADVAAMLRSGRMSQEAAAREARYRFLRETARRTEATHVATGHHADDVAETVLFRLIRGASVSGLGAVPPVRSLGGGVQLVRPLLPARRRDILAFLGEIGQPFCLDKSNLDRRHVRNRIRHDLIPYLRQHFPAFSVESLYALNESALEMAAVVDALADRVWPQAVLSISGEQVTLSAEALAEQGPAVRKAVLRKALSAVLGTLSAPGLTAEHYRLLAALPSEPVGGQIALPCSLRASREHGLVRVSHRTGTPLWASVALDVPGRTVVPMARLVLDATVCPEPVTPQQAAALASEHRVYLSLAALRPPLAVRAPSQGDRFRPLGGPGEKRVLRFLQDAGVPRSTRRATPLVVDASGRVAWVVGHRIDDTFKLPDGGGAALLLAATPAPAERTQHGCFCS